MLRKLRASWFPVLYVALLVGYEAYYLTPSVFRSWYFSSDEYVYVGEVIRFLHLDFHQHFFDQPGTPMMFLSAAVWAVLYAVEHLLGLAPAGVDLEQFTLQNLPLLFEVMRAATLIAALASIALVFVLASRLMGRAGACVAALMVMMSPSYSSWSSFIRTDSFATAFLLVSVLCLLHALDAPAPRAAAARRELRWILLSGFLAGVAAAFRLHAITAVLPLLILLLLFRPSAPPAYPVWLANSWKYALAAGFAVALAAAIASGTGYLAATKFGLEVERWWPHAFRALYPLFLAACVLIGLIWLLHRISRTRRFADRILHPGLLVLFSGCAAGFLVGTPTIIRQNRYFLQSIAFYTTAYKDMNRVSWPLLKNVAWFVNYYLRVIAPDNLSLFLLAAGALLILIKRDKRLMLFLANAILFFVSKPLNLRALHYHVIPWLPFYGVIAGYSVAAGYGALSRVRYRDIVRPLAVAALLAALAVTMWSGPKRVAFDAQWNELRMHHIALATDWIHKNAAPRAVVEISYFCFNSDVFYVWLRQEDVPLPENIPDGRRYLIWWGERSALQGLEGYACLSPWDVETFRSRLGPASPQELVDPFTDRSFQRLQTYGAGRNEIDVFRFDLSGQNATTVHR